jgi:hypothetical protein
VRSEWKTLAWLRILCGMPHWLLSVRQVDFIESFGLRLLMVVKVVGCYPISLRARSIDCRWTMGGEGTSPWGRA